MADFEIRTDTESLAQKRVARRQRKTTQWIVAGTLAVCLTFVGLIIATNWNANPPPPIAPQMDAPAEVPAKSPPSNVASSAPSTQVYSQPLVIDDDGRAMWVSPTSAGPIDLRGLPPGCEMFIALRPSALLAGSEGQKIQAAMGPLGEQGREYVERTTGLRMAEIDQLLIGLRPASGFAIETTLVVKPREGVRAPAGSDHLKLDSGALVFASSEVLQEVEDMGNLAPPLRREMQSLVDTSDGDQHATIIVSPTFLFHGGRGMWQGPMSGLRDPLFALLPDSTRGAALSFHAGDDFFAEVRLVSTIDVRPQRFAEQFADKVASWPAAVERAIAGIQTTPYSAAVVARLPAMLRVLNRYQRVGIDDEQSLLRVYLPAPAGHNLLMAGELLLAERMAGGAGSAPVGVGIQAAPKSLEDRLAQRTSLSFSRDTLETAVTLLAEDVGANIVILGSDLQLDGITKNQSFGLDEQDKPANEILVSILRQANPDKTATGPADPKQKLVYVLGRDPDTGGEAILVTTRAQAEKRGDRLPDVFAE